MNILYNQPLRFWPEGTRNTKQGLPMVDASNYQFQFQVEDIYGEFTNWCEDGDFAASTGWTISGDVGVTITGGVATGTVVGTTKFLNSYKMQEGEIYRLTVEITQNDGGGFVQFNQNGPSSIGDFNFYGTGTYQVYFIPSNDQALRLWFHDGTFEVDNVKIELVSNNYAFKAYLANESGTHQQDLTELGKLNDYLAYDIDISSYGLSNGKYQVKLLDPLTNSGSQCLVKNGDFANIETSTSFIWEFGGTSGSEVGTIEVTQNATSYVHELEWRTTIATVGSDYIKQTGVLNDAVEYTITFDVTSVSSIQLNVYAGTSASSNITTTGSKSVTLTCSGGTDLEFRFTSVGAASVVISNIQISMTDVADYSPDYESNILDYRASDCNLVRIIGVMNNNTLGLAAIDEFQPEAWYEAEIKNAEYDDDDLFYTNSQGRRSVYYFTQRKSKTFETGMLNEYMHDFIAILKGFDNIYFADKEYSIDDQYTVNWEMNDYGIGTLQISERTQKKTANNKTISSAGIDVSTTGNFLVDPNNNFIVDPSGNNIVTP